MNLDETHDPALESWVESANAPGADFPIQNLPFCLYRHGDAAPRIGVGIGNQIFDAAKYSTLTELMAMGREVVSQLRLRLSQPAAAPAASHRRVHAAAARRDRRFHGLLRVHLSRNQRRQHVSAR
jgi:fumarylacetoacetase